MSQPSELVNISHDGPVSRLTMQNGIANSLSLDMIRTMQKALDDLKERTDLKVLVLAADGPVFCAGHDLKEMRARKNEDDDDGRAYYDILFKECGQLMASIVRFPVPVIARVQGIATAAGCQLVASCDLAYAGPEAGFATPGVNIGLFCSTPMVALSRNVSNKHAMEMLLTGEIIPVERAREIGLINDFVSLDQLDQKIEETAKLIASKSKYPVKVGKEAFYRQREMDLDEAYAYTAQVMADNMMTCDAGEGIAAFLEKRVPEWTNE